jgi:hypothetical protein
LKNVQSNVEFLTNRLDSVTTEKSLPSIPVIETNYNFEISQPPKVNLTMHTPVDDYSNVTSTLPPSTPSHRPSLQHSSSIKYDVNEPPLFNDTTSNPNYENFNVETPSYSTSDNVVIDQPPSGKLV